MSAKTSMLALPLEKAFRPLQPHARPANPYRETAMKTHRWILLPALVAGLCASIARADWDPTQDAKWVQLPDTTPDGMDIKLFDTRMPPPLILADDFLCTQKGPITDVHIWGSWLFDTAPPPETLSFVISFYSDIPAGPEPENYSRPGELLWSTQIAYPDFTARPVVEVIPGEGWYDPSMELYLPNADTIIWQYNFFFDSQSCFIQEGSPDEPVVYWLAIQAFIDPSSGAEGAFGWKTSTNHWNDDAVWAMDPGKWFELRYPPEHPLAGKSIDLAFVITTTNLVEQEFDFGDAPEGALAYPATGVLGSFPTCKTVGSPGSWIQHGLGWARLGQGWDAEFDGNAGACPIFNPNQYNQDECFADGDAGLVYPEGFTITGLPGQETVVPCVVGPIPRSLGASCQVAAWGSDIDLWVINTMPVVGYVNVLMDWNQNGAWGGTSSCPAGIAAPEHVLANFSVPIGFSGPLSTLAPPPFRIGPNNGYIWTRFTITERPVLLPWIGDGQFEDGETEDYLLWVRDLDFGDAPDSPAVPMYPTLLTNNGARHVIVAGIHLGQLIDTELDGQPNANATGDDLANLPDEDGVTFTSPLIIGATATIDVVCSANGYVSAWIDFAANGNWTDPGDLIINFQNVTAGTNTFSIAIPVTATAGPTFARFRFTTQPVPILLTGLLPDGEVEDYAITLIEEAPQPLDFGDAPSPYPTLLVNNGARHQIVPGVLMGLAIDSETDGLPDPNSMGDDNSNVDDEDGVIIPPVLVAGAMTQVLVSASVPGHLNAWIDWNANGNWIDPGEHVYVNQPLLPGLNALPLNVPIPPALNPGGPHSRWRFTTYPVGAPTFTGLESDGEVEDYEVHLEVLDFGDAPSPYPTCLSADGARHRVPSGYWLGPNPPDHDPDGQPHPQALGDDLNGIADEDGVTLAGSMVQGGNAVMTIQASTNTGYLSAWVDFNQNGSWLDAGEQIVTNRLLATGFNVVTAAVPANATLGQTFARFRYSSVTGLAPTGLAPNGEVEDYAVTIWQRGPSAALVITNILYAPASDTMTIQWPGEAAVTYEAEYSAMNLPDTNIIWTPWGGYVTSAPYQQIDATPAETTKFYRVVAPHAPPPP